MDSVDILPSDLRNLRACLVCGLVKTLTQFEGGGCENCEDFIHLQGNREAIFDCTSKNFDGIVVVTDPSQSWVARWINIDKLNPGVYAMSVSGKLPKNRIDDLSRKGIAYTSRDRCKG
ncbi:hypothetical protein ACTXT7_012650 [Hymenolepis weldensis]|uniref:Transcription elongation factor SPT4 n=1 Tax=Hymenolepis diminuta TaxID=6216 RepID=A0A0R3S9N7_HYMDI|nr:unnamed protein product [Hymenolepis diminuta]VUZ47440.1 unnamed protein product [Hymenolepis diminuta]